MRTVSLERPRAAASARVETGTVIRAAIFGLFALLFALPLCPASGSQFRPAAAVGAIDGDPVVAPAGCDLVRVAASAAAVVMAVRELVRTPELMGVLRELRGITSDLLKLPRRPAPDNVDPPPEKP